MLLVGIVRRPHGLAGEVSVEIVTDFPERFGPGTKLAWRNGIETRELTVIHARGHAGRMLLTLAGVEGVDAARALSGGELLVPEKEAFAAPPGFYYSHEIEGFRCEDRSGKLLGAVRSLRRTAAGPMLTLETVEGREALVPFVEEMIVEINRERGQVVLDLPEGLLEL